MLFKLTWKTVQFDFTAGNELVQKNRNLGEKKWGHLEVRLGEYHVGQFQ